MLEELRLKPRIQGRILAGPLGPHLRTFVTWLEESGYSWPGIRRQVHAVDRFGTWLARRGLTAADVTEEVVDRFVRGLHRAPWRCRRTGRLPAVAGGARRISDLLFRHGVAVRHGGAPYATTLDLWLMSYDQHLRRVQGLSIGTRRLYLRYARRFAECRLDGTVLDWSSVTADDVVDFVQSEAGRLNPSSCRSPVTAVRAMLRFLATSSCVSAALVGAAPTVRQWKLSGLPRHLTDEQLDRVLELCDGTDRTSLRDRAILLLLARLGLRAGEIAHLRLDDLDWGGGRVRIVGTKSKRERHLPLSEEVGEALATYLRSRGSVEGVRSVFLGSRPPGPRALSAGTITSIARGALRRAGLTITRPGAHVFRHTAATQMVRRGASFKQVADVLGHALVETTTIYAKLDVDRLARVALPWPGGER